MEKEEKLSEREEMEIRYRGRRPHYRLYGVWYGMMQRCYYPKHDEYDQYGGRGIYVCQEWHVFENFQEWALKNGYDETAPRGECTIDRNNHDGPYSPDNCRWVSQAENNKNKGTYKPREPDTYTHIGRIEIDGQLKTLREWSQTTGIKYTTLYNRYIKGTRDADLIKQPHKAWAFPFKNDGTGSQKKIPSYMLPPLPRKRTKRTNNDNQK